MQQKRAWWVGLGLTLAGVITPAAGQPSDRPEFLAAFLMFGADYRNKGPDTSLMGNNMIVTNTSPLTFYQRGDDVTTIITSLDKCRYNIKQVTNKPNSGIEKPVNIEVDFGGFSDIELVDSRLGVWFLQGKGSAFWCYKEEKNGISWSQCLDGEGDKNKRITLVLDRGADDRDIAKIYRHFFTRVCRRNMID